LKLRDKLKIRKKKTFKRTKLETFLNDRGILFLDEYKEFLIGDAL
jgi:hypothetical protein